MASPFAVFRKNQKVLMAFLVGFAMIAFIVADSIDATNFPIFLGAVLGALALWLLSGKGGTEGWLIAGVGAILGAVVGVYGPTLFRDNTAIDTVHGPLTVEDLDKINRRQSLANQFLALADMSIREKLPEEQRQRMPEPDFFGFASPDSPGGSRENALLTFLFSKEADQLGINISDQAVSKFIADATGGKLTDADLRRIRSDMQVGTGDLLDAIREQLRARTAFQLLAPRVSPTPEALWTDFQKLTKEAEVSVATISAEDFVAQVEEPAKDEVERFFQQYKGTFPSGDGSPGFLVPRQIQVAYLEITLDEMKKTVEPPTDEEVLAYYEANRAQFELGHGLPGETPDAGEGGHPAPVEAPRAAPAIDQPAETPTATPPAGEKPATETPAEPAPEPESKPETPATPEGNDAAAVDSGATEFVAFQDAAAPAESAKEPEKTEPPAEPPAEAPASTDKPAETRAAPPLDPPALPAPPAATRPATPPSPQTLESIRRDLLNQRARAAADARVEQVREDIYNLVHRIMDTVPIPEDSRDPEQKQKYDAERRKALLKIGEEVEAYAKKNNLKFVRTPLMSGEEMLESEDYQIGQAVRWEKNAPLFNRDTTPLVQTLFMTSPDQPISPIAAQSLLNESRFVALKVADVEPRIPSLEDEGIRDAVVKAWKLRKARDLARARAEELAKAAGSTKERLADFGKTQTVTGKEGGPELTVRQVGPFAWLRRTTAPSTDFAPPEIVPTALPQLPAAGEKFMQVVFEKLGEGEVGTAPSEDGSAYFVVQVDRRSSEEELAKAREQFLKEDFFSHPLDGLFGFPMNPFRRRMMIEARDAQADWFEKFRERHEVADRESIGIPPEAGG